MKKIVIALLILLFVVAVSQAGPRQRFGIKFIPVYPAAQSGTFVKATSELTANYLCYFATNPNSTLKGSSVSNSWIATNTNPQRFHIDLGSAMAVNVIYYENYHHNGGDTDTGAKTFSIQGSNTAASFAELTYATDTGWTTLQSGLQFDQHSAADNASPKYIVFANTGLYRYYAIKIADNWGDATILGLRRVELQQLIGQ